MRCASSSWRSVLAGLLLAASAPLAAQDCPRVDAEAQKAKEQECRAAGGQWSRFGVRDHLCGIYSCAPKTADGGKACRNHADCEYLCISKREAALGTETTGECAAFRTSFGCTTHVNGGRIAGRTCLD
jgi:hypothetical protein